MKFFSVIVLAALCATAVSAAPQTTPNFSFQEYGLSNIFEGVGKKLKEYMVNVKCMRDVVTKAVKDSEFKNVWNETKTKLDILATDEWEKCLNTTDFIEKYKCKATVIEKGLGAIPEFLKKLMAEAKWDMVKDIKKKIASECFQKHDATYFDLDDEVEELRPSIAEQFECLAQVLGDVSKANGLEGLWSKSEPQLLDRIGKWKQCPMAGGKFLVILCDIKEGVATYKLMTTYVRLAAAENPKVIQEFAQQSQQKCAGQIKFNGDELAEGWKITEKIKCINAAITDAVKETEFKKTWDEYKKELEKVNERIMACKNEPSKWEAAKCVGKEAQHSGDIFHKFIADLKNANVETYKRVKQYIKQRCYA